MSSRVTVAFIAIAVASPVCFAQNAFVPAPIAAPLPPPSTAAFGSGQCVADFDGDGDLDIIIAPSAGGAFTMLRNDGAMQFTDVSAQSGLGVHPGAICMQNADIDNDGDQDVFVAGTFQPARCYINNGSGAFVDQAATLGLTRADDTYHASFGDYDRDGWLDLAVGNRVDPSFVSWAQNRIYHNNGDGSFTDVTASIGFGQNLPTWVVTWVDFDENGWPDLFVCNDRGVVFGPNELYVNNGDGTFTEKAAQFGAADEMDAMGFDFLDAFNDGGIDFFVTDGPPDHLFREWNPAQGRYLDITAATGVQGGGVGWCCYFFDYDNDSWFDIYVVQRAFPNCLFRNPGGSGTWPNVAPGLGIAQDYDQYTASIGDFDNDGAIDVLHRYAQSFVQPPPTGSMLFRNQVAVGNWLRLDLEGTRSNRDGFGARVEVDAGALVRRQHCRNGIGYLSSSDPRVHFGLGAATQADRVTIHWPSGQVQYLTNVAANQDLVVVEPRMIANPTVPVGSSTTITASIPGDEGLPYLMPISLGANNGITLPDGRVFPLDLDSVLEFTLDPLNPILVGSFGLLDAQGQGTATFNVPALPWLSGLTVYSAALTLDAPTFPLIRTIVSAPVAVTIQ